MADSPTIYDPTSTPLGKKLIFRRFRVDPVTGELRDAWKYGIKAWPMWVDADDSK